jgi:hypothetical protein
MISISRVVVPIMFLIEGVSYHSFLLDLTGGELLVLAYVLGAIRSSDVCTLSFLLTLPIQILLSIFFGHSFVGHWIQFEICMFSYIAIHLTNVSRENDMILELKKLNQNHELHLSNIGSNDERKVSDFEKKIVFNVLNGTDNNTISSNNNRSTRINKNNRSGSNLRQRNK